MKPKRLSKFKLLGLIIFGLVAIHFIFFRAPSEAQMLTKFHQHITEFEQIRLMLKQDKNVSIINSDWVKPRYSEEPDGVEMHELPLNISESRIALYRSRLKNLGLSDVNTGSTARNKKIWFYQFGGGFTDTSWSIGYIWSAKPLSPLVKSAYSQVPMRDTSCYSRIEGNWYLYQSR